MYTCTVFIISKSMAFIIAMKLALLLGLLVHFSHSLPFEGFYTTNYNETITVCTYDVARGVLLGRTHWPDIPFNEDSAALTGVIVNDGWFFGSGASIEGGAYSFSMRLGEGTPNSIGSFSFLNKVESGVWDWTYVRPPTDSECLAVTSVWE